MVDEIQAMESDVRPLVYPDATIRGILAAAKVIAVVGASPNEARPSFGVMRFLLSKGFRVIPVNPGQAGRAILGQPCFADLASIGQPVDMIDVFRASDDVPGIVEEALALEPRPAVIWMQLGVRHDEAALRAEATGVTVVMNRCPAIEYARLL